MKIAPATQAKIAERTPKGSRHQTAKDIAVSMIGDGNSEQDVFSILRQKFESDMLDTELRKIVTWAAGQHFGPSKTTGNSAGYRFVPPSRIAAKPELTPLQHSEWWLSGSRMTIDQTAAKSPEPLTGDRVSDACLAIGALYAETDRLNVVCKFMLEGEKARPCGAGQTLTRDGWIEWIKEKGVPSSKAGAWMRLNPCAEIGSGDGGAQKDSDVVAHRYLLVESDTLPIETQLSLYCRLQIPVVAIVMSGGLSAHAWVRIDAEDGERFSESAKRILDVLKPFGIDHANCNASRLSRLPGAVRVIGARDGGLQRLIWLNPGAEPLTDAGILRLEESLKFPAIEDRPLRSIAERALVRYDEIRRNVGKLGIPIGVPEFDDMSGGLKPGHTIVLAGKTGQGKSTMALHFVASALLAGYGVGLFSLEMDADEVFDLLVSHQLQVDRNKFNTGKFLDSDIDTISGGMPKLMSLPLYIEDSAFSAVEDIRIRTIQLVTAGKIHLLVVDYIQFVNVGISRDTREQQVANISHGLRTLARECKIPVVVLSQLNEEGNIRESRVISHNANIVMTVEVVANSVTLKIVKGRGIPCKTYHLEFARKYSQLIPKPREKNSDAESPGLPYPD